MKKQEAKIAFKTPGPGREEHTAPPGAVVTISIGNRVLPVWLEEEICALGVRREHNGKVIGDEMFSCDGC